MRVLLLCNEYPPHRHGGIGTFCTDYAEGLVAAGHEVHVLEVRGTRAERESSAVRVHTIPEWPFRRARATLSRLRLSQHLRLLCRSIQPDVFEAPDFGGWVPFVRPPVPLVVRLHGAATLIAPFNGDQVKRSARLFERRTLQLSAHWIAPTQFALRATQSVFGLQHHRSSIVYNPLPAPPPATVVNAALPDGPFVLYAGWLNRGKGALPLGRALPAFFEAAPEAHAVLLGQDVDVGGRSTIDQIREIVGPSDAHRVHFPGHVSREQVQAWMKLASAFVLPSSFETFGLVYLEALRAGLPVIASDRSAEAELFAGMESVTMVNPGHPEEIARALAGALRPCKELSARIARDKELISSRFSMERCVQDSLRVYESVCENWGGTA